MFRFDMFETDIYDVAFEIYIADKLVKKQTMQTSSEDMLIINFMQMAQRIRNDQRPMKIKMIKSDVIWDKFEQREKTLNNEISASNDAMIAWEENNNKEGV